MTNTRHKNADVIIAFAEGKQIQSRHKEHPFKWRDMDGLHGIDNDCFEWRIKPEKQKLWINIYPSGGVQTYTSKENADKYCGRRIACIEIEYEIGEGL